MNAQVKNSGSPKAPRMHDEEQFPLQLVFARVLSRSVHGLPLYHLVFSLGSNCAIQRDVIVLCPDHLSLCRCLSCLCLCPLGHHADSSLFLLAVWRNCLPKPVGNIFAILLPSSAKALAVISTTPARDVERLSMATALLELFHSAIAHLATLPRE